jgi:hypothetical protein
MIGTFSLIKLIATLGWRDFSPEKAAEALNVPLSDIPPKEQILKAFHGHITEKLKETVDLSDLKEAPFKEQVMEIILCRLELLTPYKPSLQRIYSDLKEDPCSIPAFMWQGNFETEWLDLVGTQNPLQTKLLGLVYGAVIYRWIEEDDLNKTMAFLDRLMGWV